MAIPDRMLTNAELQAIIDHRTTVRNTPNGPASGWTAMESNAVRNLLARLSELAIDRVGMTAEQHRTKMDTDPRYRHFWRMDSDAEYVAAWSYLHSAEDRAATDADSTRFDLVAAGFRKYAFELTDDPSNLKGHEAVMVNDPAIVTDSLVEDSPPPPTPPAPATLVQSHFRGRNDDGHVDVLSGGATFKAAMDTNFSQAPGVNFRLRMLVENTSVTGYAVGGMQLWCAKNAGLWQPVNGASSIARSALSPHVRGGDAIRSLLTEPAPSTPWLNNKHGFFEEADGFAYPMYIGTNNIAEHEYCLQLVTADLVAGDTVSFQLRRGMAPGASTLLDAYPVVPVVTVV